MQIILKKDVDGVGKGGDIVTVKDGHARNFLIPKGYAVEASQKNKKMIDHQLKQIQAKIETERAEAMTLGQRISNTSCTIPKHVGEAERLFGSVTAKDIEEALREEGIVIDRKQIMLEEQIKALGVYEVPIKLYNEISASVKVWVVAK